MTDTDYKLTCPGSNDGAHEWKSVVMENAWVSCSNCGYSIDVDEFGSVLNAAARHIARLEKHINSLAMEIDRLEAMSSQIMIDAALSPLEQIEHIPIDQYVRTRFVTVEHHNEICDRLAAENAELLDKIARIQSSPTQEPINLSHIDSELTSQTPLAEAESHEITDSFDAVMAIIEHVEDAEARVGNDEVGNI